MGLDAIIKKGKVMGKSSRTTRLKINKYDHSKETLDLIAHICTRGKHIDVGVDACFDNVYDSIIEMEIEVDSDECFLTNKNFYSELKDELFELRYEYYIHHYFVSTKIAVAGGYSSGKSTFLNALLNSKGMLPTGIEPVSIVNTQIACSKSFNKLQIRGINVKDEVVNLNEEVLACIQHGSKSEIHISSVLDKLTIEMPVKAELDGITFIDTPGYNNSKNINESNNKTDQEEAIECLKTADVIFWCIDIEAGTITKEDFNQIKNSETTGPIVFIFTKMDKKTDAEVKNILSKAMKVAKGEFPQRSMYFIAHSSTTNKYYSPQGKDLPSIFKAIKINQKHTNPADVLVRKIMAFFDHEIEASNECLLDLEKRRLETVKRKNDSYRLVLEAEKNTKVDSTILKNVLTDNYDSLVRCKKAFDTALDGWSKALDREKRCLDSASPFIKDYHARACVEHKKLKSGSPNDYRSHHGQEMEDWIESINAAVEYRLEDFQRIYEEISQNLAEIVQESAIEKNCNKILKKYRDRIYCELQASIQKSNSYIKRELESLSAIPTTSYDCIFTAIASNNNIGFYDCLSIGDGVDLTVTNKEGYNPMTYAVAKGRIDLVKFFIDQKVDLTIKDRFNNNVLETAVLHHNQGICDLLIRANRDLINESRRLTDIAKENKFYNWITSLN